MKLLVISLLAGSALMAQNLKYTIKAPLFGSIGEVKVNYNVGSNYTIDATMKTSGFAKKLSGNRVERYHAEGKVLGNTYKAKSFRQDFSYKNKRGVLEYIFDYNSKTITKNRKKWKESKQTTNKSRKLEFFTYNDLFSVYHNIVATLKGKPAGTYKVQVAGMEKTGGYLSIKIPSIKVQKKEAKSLGVKDVWVFHIITHRKIMKSDNGEIIFAVGNNGIAKGVRVLNTAYVNHIDAILN
jgi:hypothetical protein